MVPCVGTRCSYLALSLACFLLLFRTGLSRRCIRHLPNSVLEGATQLRDLRVNSLRQCVQKCFTQTKHCKAAVFHRTPFGSTLCNLFSDDSQSPGVSISEPESREPGEFYNLFELTGPCGGIGGSGNQAQRTAKWSPWRAWTPCSSTCGPGSRSRKRSCRGNNCRGQDTQSQQCDSGPCAEWSRWSRWAECTASCGPGKKKRTRTCTPANFCFGRAEETRQCLGRQCPKWSMWAPWTPCSSSCGSGSRTRNRECRSVAGCPIDEPCACPGPPSQKQDCDAGPCSHWATWGPWGACAESCSGSSIKTRSRECVGGEFCLGKSKENQMCPTEPKCIPQWGPWNPWGDCDCEKGRMERSRICERGDCLGQKTESRACRDLSACARWGPWQPWQPCNCEKGRMERSRICERGDCLGQKTESRTCRDLSACARWGPWQPWQPCNCEKGRIERIRICERGDCLGQKTESRACRDLSACARWGPWQPWQLCNCEKGTMERRRICERGDCVGQRAESRACRDLSDCARWSSWQPWGECDCEAQQRMRKRVCVGGPNCEGKSTQTNPCFPRNCVKAKWEIWRPWGACTVSCGAGTRRRTRLCPSSECPGIDYQKEVCDMENCPRPPIWGQWVPWGKCDCDSGSKHRTRSCEFGKCVGQRRQSKDCDYDDCQQTPEWQAWRTWQPCDVTCGQGVQQRARSCPSDNQSRNCPGRAKQERDCNLPMCAKDPPQWTTWGTWGQCDVTCGRGIKLRARICPLSGNCRGRSKQERDCNQPACPEWNPWGPWQACDVTCGSGVQLRARTCPIGNCPGLSRKERVCNQPACPVVPPEWNPWGPWQACDVTCGSGVQLRARTCPFGNCPGLSRQKRVCNQPACPVVPPEWNPWGPWQACDVTCGSGVQPRARTCPFGNCPGVSRQERVCNQPACPVVPPEWNPWRPWQACDVTCGSGVQLRARTCPFGNCPGLSRQERVCNQPACPVVPPEWNPWGPWQACDVTCGSGVQLRARTCPIGNCPGLSRQERVCNQPACPVVPPEWNPWGPWQPCDVTCGSGVQLRARTCPFGNCPGLSRQERVCNQPACPVVPPEWNPWGPWQACDVTCGSGVQLRARTCPIGNCPGLSRQERVCNQPACPVVPPEWNPWGPWQPCDVTCGSGVQLRARICPFGKCPGRSRQERVCNRPACPTPIVPTIWSPWAPWGPCDCNVHLKFRMRQCLSGNCIRSEEKESKACTGRECMPTITTTQPRSPRTPAPPQWEHWDTWQACDVTCGKGIRRRIRRCQTSSCLGRTEEKGDCLLSACPTSKTIPPTTPAPFTVVTFPPAPTTTAAPVCFWGQWGPFGLCSQTCGIGKRYRLRHCYCYNGRGRCHGTNLQSQACRGNSCLQVWQVWRPWSPCSVSCGVGSRWRTRACNSGRVCSTGGKRQTRLCSGLGCAKNGWPSTTRSSYCSYLPSFVRPRSCFS